MYIFSMDAWARRTRINRWKDESQNVLYRDSSSFSLFFLIAYCVSINFPLTWYAFYVQMLLPAIKEVYIYTVDFLYQFGLWPHCIEEYLFIVDRPGAFAHTVEFQYDVKGLRKLERQKKEILVHKYVQLCVRYLISLSLLAKKESFIFFSFSFYLPIYIFFFFKFCFFLPRIWSSWKTFPSRLEEFKCPGAFTFKWWSIYFIYLFFHYHRHTFYRLWPTCLFFSLLTSTGRTGFNKEKNTVHI